MTKSARILVSLLLPIFIVSPLFAQNALVTSLSGAVDIRIAKDAEDKKDPRQTLVQVAGIMTKCVQCHATYRLVDMAHTGN